MTPPRIAIFSDNTGWHEERLLGAFATRGAYAAVVSLQTCRIGTVGTACGVMIPGFADRLPDAAFVRAIPDGTFEEVTFRLDILHALQEAGVLVHNPARAIERTVDKAMTTVHLCRAGIATPETWVCESREEAVQITERELAEGRTLVYKPLFGNCGRGLIFIDQVDTLPEPEPAEGVYYLQRYIAQPGGAGRDWRIFVIRNSAVAAMERVSHHWITNRARGGDCLPAVMTEDLRVLAEHAAAAVGACYAGVDIILEGGRGFQVLEVNGVPAWRGLQSVCPIDISERLADDLLDRLRTTPQRAARL
jgi:tetrahydromethanopterin:alpha-L-glutamate ligase